MVIPNERGYIIDLKIRSSDVAEEKFIKKIIKGEFEANKALPSERELALYFEVGRPTIREVLQRLERNGWITIRKGMPPIVNNYWKHGNLLTIVGILNSYEEVPDEFIEYVLELRIVLSPAYIKDAVERHPHKVISLFTNLEDLEEDAAAFAHFDWELQINLAGLSSNPIYLLILNSFKEVFLLLAEKYFAISEHRQVTRDYYYEFLNSLFEKDIQKTEAIIKTMMQKSLELWKIK